jgi:hypothetical protein
MSLLYKNIFDGQTSQLERVISSVSWQRRKTFCASIKLISKVFLYGINFIHMTIRCQQEKVTLSRFLRRTEIVEGYGFDARRIGRSGCMAAHRLDKYPKWRTES